MVDIRLEMFSSPVMDSSYFPTCLFAMKLLLMTQMKMFGAENKFVKIRTPGTCRPAPGQGSPGLDIQPAGYGHDDDDTQGG